MSLVKNIANNVVTKAPSGPQVTFGELWADQRCVIVFFRRFGWPYCRLAAREISALQPILDQHNVKLIGVGLEKLGVEDFIAGNFFTGDLYIDEGTKSYKALGFKKMGVLSVVPSIISSAARAAQARIKALGLGGNMEGEKYQNGGALIVEKGGEKQLLHYVQQSAPDHVSNEQVLEALGLSQADQPAPTAETAAATATATD